MPMFQTNPQSMTFKFPSPLSGLSALKEAVIMKVDDECIDVDETTDKYSYTEGGRLRKEALGFSTNWLETPHGEYYLTIVDTDSTSVFYAICEFLSKKGGALSWTLK